MSVKMNGVPVAPFRVRTQYFVEGKKEKTVVGPYIDLVNVFVTFMIIRKQEARMTVRKPQKA